MPCRGSRVPVQASVFGELCHASGARYIAHGGQKDIGVCIFQCGGDVFGNGFFVIEVVGCNEGSKFGHAI